MNFEHLRAEMYVGFMAIEEHLGAQLPFFEKINPRIHRHFSAKKPLLENVEPVRLELIESARKSEDSLKGHGAIFFRVASDDDINGLFTGISKTLTIQGCILVYEHFEKFDRCISRDVLREELLAFAEKIKNGRKELEKAFFNKFSFHQGLGEVVLEAMDSDSYAQKHLSAYFLSLEEYIDLLMDERYIDEIQVRKVKKEVIVNNIHVNGNNNTIIQGVSNVQLSNQSMQHKK